MTIYGSATEFLIKEWVKFYKQSPKITVSISIISLCVSVAVGYITDKQQREEREIRRLQNQSYVKQVESLDQVRNNLKTLIEFVDSEKKQLELSEKTLTTMKSEHERLKPLVEADRKVIDALFSAQEARNQEAQNRERWIGFGLGVLASLIASIVWAVIAYVIRKRNNAPTV